MADHIEVTLDKIREMYSYCQKKIDELKSGEKLKSTDLIPEIAKKFNYGTSDVYTTLNLFLKTHPDIEVKRGVKGGIYKK
ncbi:MAG: hypothetical protein LC122_12230 [Chitinophagales bacterium]|nr:hypothetical protein [Chitinophagales bacterium]